MQPIVVGDSYQFTVKTGKPPESLHAGTTAGKRHAFLCLLSKVPIDYDYIRAEGKAGRMSQKLMGIVAEGPQGRVYLGPEQYHADVAASEAPSWVPEHSLPDNLRDFKTPNYGLLTFGSLFTPRQLVALNTFSELISKGS